MSVSIVMLAIWMILAAFDGRFLPANLFHETIREVTERRQPTNVAFDPQPYATRAARAAMLYWIDNRRQPRLTDICVGETVPPEFKVKLSQTFAEDQCREFQILVEIVEANGARTFGTMAGSWRADSVLFGNSGRLGDHISIDGILFVNCTALASWHGEFGNISEYRRTVSSSNRGSVITEQGEFISMDERNGSVNLYRRLTSGLPAEFRLRGLQAGDRGVWRTESRDDLHLKK